MIVKNEIDDFTGKKVKETSSLTIDNGLTCMIREVGGIKILMVSFGNVDNTYTMEKGAHFMLKQENGSIITLTNLEYAESEYWTTLAGSTHSTRLILETKYLLYDEDLNELKANKIVKVRFITTHGYIDRNLSEWSSDRLLKLFNLM
jgi:hypothetical protein